MCWGRCQGRDCWRAAGIFTERLGDGTTVVVGGSEASSWDKIDASERDTDALRYTIGVRACCGEGLTAMGVPKIPCPHRGGSEASTSVKRQSQGFGEWPPLIGCGKRETRISVGISILDLDKLKQYLQRHLTDGLVTVVGSGLSCAEGLPSMGALGDHLRCAIGPSKLDAADIERCGCGDCPGCIRYRPRGCSTPRRAKPRLGIDNIDHHSELHTRPRAKSHLPRSLTEAERSHSHAS